MRERWNSKAFLRFVAKGCKKENPLICSIQQWSLLGGEDHRSEGLSGPANSHNGP